MSQTANESLGEYSKPLPHIDERNSAHWEGAREGRLMIQACSDCATPRYPFAKICPHCHSVKSDWIETSGKGEVWSWCVFHRAYFKGFETEMPYNVVIVKLDEGPRLYSNLVGISNKELKIGMRVRAVFERATDAVTLVKFAQDSER